jgi:general nucleoside transport system permease protein
MNRRLLLDWIPIPAAGIVLCAVIGVVHGVRPLDLPAAIWTGAWGTPEAGVATLSKMPPLLLTGLAVALAHRIGLLNIGCEGQLVLGALAAASVGVVCYRLPTAAALGLPLVVGAAVGGLWALPAVWLRQRRGVHEVLTTLLLNYVAVFLAEYLVLGSLGDGTALGRTPLVADRAVWSGLGTGVLRDLTAAPLVALALCVAAQAWLSWSVAGYEVTASGKNSEAAQGGGIPVERRQRLMFLLSGALAGLAGAIEVASIHHRFYRAFSPGYGFDGITVAFLVHGAPGWLWLSGLLLASLRSADKWLQLSLGISPGIIWVIQAVLLLTVACRARTLSR